MNTLKLPLELDENNQFILIEDIQDELLQKFKILLLTNPGEKIMSPEFGAGIRKLLFEMASGLVGVEYIDDQAIVYLENFKARVESVLRYQLLSYLPEISLNGLQVVVEDQVLTLKIYYGEEEEDFLSFSAPLD